MSVNREQINITNFKDLEEGEISDSYINKQDIFKLIEENKNKNKIFAPDDKKKSTSCSFQKKIVSQEEESNSESEEENVKYFLGEIKASTPAKREESDDEDDEPQGFFHKMLKSDDKEDKSLLTKKRGSSFDMNRTKNQISQKNYPPLQYQQQNEKLTPQINKQNQIIHKPNKDRREQDDEKNKSNKNFMQKNQQKQKIKQPKLICQFYQNGACNKGAECTFSHDVVQNKKKRDLCKYFLTGNCFKANNCIFSHNTNEFPCKFFHAVGYCDKGDICKFSHQRLLEEDINQFLEQNEDFLIEHYKLYGKTNMDDYLRQYVQEKKNLTFEDFLDKMKIPQNAMIPSNMNQTNINKMQNPINMPKIAALPLQNINNPQDSKSMPLNVQSSQSIQSLPGANMFPRLIPPGMNVMMLQQQQQQMMMMRNPMFMQWMRPQMMQNMMRMNMMAKNFNAGNATNQIQMNQQQMTMNPNISIDPNQTQQQNKETTGKELNVNISDFIRNINPFDKSQIKISNDKTKIKTNEIYEKRDDSIDNEDEEEGNFFLKSVGVNSSLQKGEAEREKNKCNYPQNTNDNKNVEISNILQFVNILKMKKDSENDIDEIPRDPRIKNKKK